MSLLPQFGFFELITVAVIALIVVGPQDLPKLMRSAGRMVRQARALAGEFTAAFDQMARETEIEEMRKEIAAIKNDNVFTDVKDAVSEAVDPLNDAIRNEANELRDAANRPAASDAAADAYQDDIADWSDDHPADEDGYQPTPDLIEPGMDADAQSDAEPATGGDQSPEQKAERA